MSDRLSFVHVTDIHVGSPRSYRFRAAYNENWERARQQIVALNPDLLLVGGDLTRDGNLHDFEFEGVKASLDGMGTPYLAIPGNMDTGNKHTDRQGFRTDRDDLALNVTEAQLDRFIEFFGPLPWSVVYNNVRFSGFYAAVAGSGLRHEDEMWRWLEDLHRLPRAEHHVMLMHYALFIDRIDEPTFDITDPENYIPWYFGIDEPHRSRIFDAFKAAGVEIVLSGHIHCRRPVQVAEGMRFYKGAATAFSQQEDRWADGDPTLGFHRFEVTPDGIRDTFVPLETVSTSTAGYGPGGHPKPEERDYSLAWEKS